MKGYEYIGKGREDGAEKGEYSAIFYNTQNLTLLESNTIWLSESPEEPSIGWDASYKRVCTYGLFTAEIKSVNFGFIILILIMKERKPEEKVPA